MLHPAIIATSSASSFQKSSLDWSLQKLIQRGQEWFEYQFQSMNVPDNAPEPWEWPNWIGRSLFWLMIGVITVWAVWQLYQVLRPYVAEWRSPLTSSTTISSKTIRRSPQDWWQQAQTLRQQGRYQEACFALYRGMLQQFQDKKQIPSQESYTDGEYWQVLQKGDGADACKVLLDAHEETVFGEVQASDELVNRCQQAYRKLTSP